LLDGNSVGAFSGLISIDRLGSLLPVITSRLRVKARAIGSGYQGFGRVWLIMKNCEGAPRKIEKKRRGVQQGQKKITTRFVGKAGKVGIGGGTSAPAPPFTTVGKKKNLAGGGKNLGPEVYG